MRRSAERALQQRRGAWLRTRFPAIDGIYCSVSTKLSVTLLGVPMTVSLIECDREVVTVNVISLCYWDPSTPLRVVLISPVTSNVVTATVYPPRLYSRY